MKLDLDFFTMRITDQIIREDVTDTTISADQQYQNKGKVKYTGAEVDLKFQFFNRLTGFFYYTYVVGYDETNKDDEDGESIKLTNLYHNAATLGLSYDFFDQFQLSLSSKYLDKWVPQC